MSIGTLFQFLIGRRAAIERIAATPQALWVGALLVVSAALAREYDAKDLLNEPWYLLVPLVASLATSFALYYVIRLVGLFRLAEQSPFWPMYRRFLRLYWTTAPLAWLYAIPVERFLSAADSTAANLWLLAIVALWRVALMTRVVQVEFGTTVVAAFFMVELFADTLTLIILNVAPIPIFHFMGGIPLSHSEAIIQGTAILVGFVSGVTWPVWVIGVVVLSCGARDWRTTPPMHADQKIQPTLWGLAGFAVLGWAGVLPLTQPPQQLRYRADFLLQEGRVLEAVEFMSCHEQSEFPPHYDPPPWLAYRFPHPPLMDVVDVILTQPVAPWVEAAFNGKLGSQIREWTKPYLWRDREPEEKDAILNALERFSPIKDIDRSFDSAIQQEPDETRKARLRDILIAAGIKIED